MPKPVKAGVPIIGVIFLVLAVIQFLKGDSWVVWAILAFLLGGFSIFTTKRPGGTDT
jgi:hypothetical protein